MYVFHTQARTNSSEKGKTNVSKELSNRPETDQFLDGSDMQTQKEKLTRPIYLDWSNQGLHNQKCRPMKKLYFF